MSAAGAIAFGAVVAMSTVAGAQESGIRLYAAGSLRVAMTEVAQAFTASRGPAVNATFGASGLLRERIEKGEAVDAFASADLGNPQALAMAGRARSPIVFARNRLCARSWRRGSMRRRRRCSIGCSIRR